MNLKQQIFLIIEIRVVRVNFLKSKQKITSADKGNTENLIIKNLTNRVICGVGRDVAFTTFSISVV